MPLNFKIVRNYSQALYFISKREKEEEEVLKQMLVLEQIFLHSLMVMKGLCSPIVDIKLKQKIITLASLELVLKKNLTHFLHTIIKHSRFSLIFDIIKDFSKIIANSKNIKYVHIASAYKLKTKDINSISIFLENLIGKKIHLEKTVNSALIGGVTIEYDSNLIDCSVSGLLDRIKTKCC